MPGIQFVDLGQDLFLYNPEKKSGFFLYSGIYAYLCSPKIYVETTAHQTRWYYPRSPVQRNVQGEAGKWPRNTGHHLWKDENALYPDFAG